MRRILSKSIRRDPRKEPRRVDESVVRKVGRAIRTVDFVISAENGPSGYVLDNHDIRSLKGVKGRTPKIKSTVKPSWTRGKDPQPPRKPQPMVDWRTAKKAKPSRRIDDADYHPEHYLKR